MSKMRFFALQELANRQPLEVTTPSNKLSDYYGSHVFDRKKMQEYLPREAYKAVTDAIEKRHSHQPRNGRPDCQRHEKLGKVPQRHPLHALVPASDGRNSRET